jgi:hypothetical protein
MTLGNLDAVQCCDGVRRRVRLHMDMCHLVKVTDDNLLHCLLNVFHML